MNYREVAEHPVIAHQVIIVGPHIEFQIDSRETKVKGTRASKHEPDL